MTTLKIALLQMASHGFDQQANLEKGERFCRQAKALGADIALFPEMWNIGYTAYSPDVWRDDFDPHDPAYDSARESWYTHAIDQDSAFFKHFQSLAAELDMAIALTYLEKWPSQPRNTVALIDRHGHVVLTYAKVHTCDFSMEAALTPGEDFYVYALDTAAGTVNIGAMICYDREFPESARVLMLKGAEIIVIPNACDWEQNRAAQLRSRAYENMIGVAMTNYAMPPQMNGHSCAFDGMAFGAKGSRDMMIVEAGEREGIYIADFDLAALRDYRVRETWGNAFRKRRAYSVLTSDEVSAPFVRDLSRR